MLSPDELGRPSRAVRRRRAANRDPLSGLSRERAYIPQLAEEWMLDNRWPTDCAFVDIDNFDRINEEYGQEVADRVRCSIARLLLICERDNGQCVRYDDEEIVVFLSATDERAAVDVAELIRRTIAGHGWGHIAPGLQVTASIGVAPCLHNEPIARLIHRAKQAQLEAKRRGGNGVVRASSLADRGPSPTSI